MGEREEEWVWVEQSRNGDPAAFEPLVRRYQRMIHALTYRMTGSLDDAEDLAQETFVHAYQQLAGFRREARFSSWLYRIAINRSLNWRKREQRQDRLRQEWGNEVIGASAGHSDGSHAVQVQEALLQLPPKQRAAMVLTVYDGLNHAEAAQVLGCTEATVSWRVFAARAKLRRLLQHCQP